MTTVLASEEYYIIVPAEATNEISYNPSFELSALTSGSYGVTAVGAGVSIARVTTQQRRQLASLEITTASGVDSGFYYGTVNEVSGVARTFSADVKGYAGQAMRIQIRTTAGAVLSETTFTANSYWQRPSITRTGTASTTRRLYIVRDSVASTEKFYVDGLYYSTVNGTYLDGDMKGFLKGVSEYRWLGTPHASQSWRSGQTRSGGTLMRIADYARVLFTLGLGLLPVTNIASPTTANYSSYQTSAVTSRQFILNMAFSGTPGQVRDKRNAIGDALWMDKTAIKQPTVIRYVGLDGSGGEATETLDITGHYIDGLQDDPTDIPTIAPVRFDKFLPYLERSGESGVTLGFQTSVTNAANIMMRTSAGVWQAMGTGLNDAAYSMAIGPDGCLYVGGAFTLAGGVANTAYIAKWDGSAWSALGTGMNGVVKKIVFGPDGTLYAGGVFTLAGGVANTVHIAKWDGANWTPLGTGTNGNVWAVAMDYLGNLYIGGEFTLAGGVANTVRIAKWNGSAWSALGTGLNERVNAIEVSPNNQLYIGGRFTADVSGATPMQYIGKWTGSAYAAMGTGFNSFVNTIKYASGKVYIGGQFTADVSGAILYPYSAMWNGKKWSKIPGINTLGNEVHNIYLDQTTRDIHITGQMHTVNGGRIPCPDVIYRGGAIAFLDVDTQDDIFTIFYAMAVDTIGNLYIGGYAGSTTALSATVTVPIIGGVRAYPIVKFTGPGWVPVFKNYSTGRAIYLNNLTLLAGEVVTLDLRPGRKTFTSSFRGDLDSYIMPGSNKDLFLQGGNNNVSAYMTGTTAASGITMVWQDLYAAQDGAKR